MQSLLQEEDFIISETQLDADGSLSVDPVQPQPDIIIVAARTGTSVRTLLSQISQHFPQTPIVVVNSQEDWVKLYDHREIVIHEQTELISAIRSLQASKESK